MRNDQERLRRDLLDAYLQTYAGTGCSVPETLQAAHIIDYHGSRSNTVTNGLLLRADIHSPFDRSLLSTTPKTRSLLAPLSYAEIMVASRKTVTLERATRPLRHGSPRSYACPISGTLWPLIR